MKTTVYKILFKRNHFIKNRWLHFVQGLFRERNEQLFFYLSMKSKLFYRKRIQPETNRLHIPTLHAGWVLPREVSLQHWKPGMKTR